MTLLEIGHVLISGLLAPLPGSCEQCGGEGIVPNFDEFLTVVSDGRRLVPCYGAAPCPACLARLWSGLPEPPGPEG